MCKCHLFLILQLTDIFSKGVHAKILGFMMVIVSSVDLMRETLASLG